MHEGSMKNFEVISLDAYGTLLNPSIGMDLAVKKFIKPGKLDSAEKLWRLFFSEINNLFKIIESDVNNEFVCAKELYRQIYFTQGYFRNIGISVDEFIRMICFAHSNSAAYEGAHQLIFDLQKTYQKVILTSDADVDFLIEAVEKNGFDFEHIITSEEAKGYKAQHNSSLFNRLVEVSGVSPNKILHIGDSIYDTKRSKELGITAMLLCHNADENTYNKENIIIGLDGIRKLLL
jgi:FMN phosphatase YigB (HAD superfamily)